MVKILIVVLCYLYYAYKVSCPPVIKASGVQWSEPKGTGKGNITLIIIPQNNSQSNDTDVIVAVKSDYQIMSQDMQLLSLIVNETQNDKINQLQCDGEAPVNCIKTDTGKQNSNEWDLNKINLPYTANYFEPYSNSFNKLNYSGNLPLNSKNHSSAVFTTSELKSMKLLNLLGSIVNDSSVMINNYNTGNDNNHPLATTSTANLHSDFNSSETNLVLGLNNKTSSKKENTGNLKRVQPLDGSRSSFLREALDIFEKLKQNPTYYATDVKRDQAIHSSAVQDQGEICLSDTKPKNIKGGELALADEDLLVKEFIPSGIDKNNFEGDMAIPPPTTCVPFFFLTGDNQEINSSLSSNVVSSNFNFFNNQETSVEHNSITAPATLGDNNEETATPLPTTKAFENKVTGIFDNSSAIPQAAKGNASNLIEQIGPISEKCTTVILQCENTTSNNSVFNQISEMVCIENNKVLIESPLPELAVTKSMNEAGIGNFTNTVITECSTFYENSNLPAGKEPIPKRITLEPQENCDQYLQTKTPLSAVQDQDLQLNVKNDNLPLIQSSVFLADNYEMPKGKEIPILLNTSLDDFRLAQFIEKAEHEHDYRKPAELYGNCNPLVLRIGSKSHKISSLGPLIFLNNNRMNKEIIKHNPRQKSCIDDTNVNNVLKMQFAGKNLILEQRPSYRSQMSNNKQECESTLEILTDSDREMDSGIFFQGRLALTTDRIMVTDTSKIPTKIQSNHVTLNTDKTSTVSYEKLLNTEDLTEKSVVLTKVYTLVSSTQIKLSEKENTEPPQTSQWEDETEYSQSIQSGLSFATTPNQSKYTNKLTFSNVYESTTKMILNTIEEASRNAEEMKESSTNTTFPRAFSEYSTGGDKYLYGKDLLCSSTETLPFITTEKNNCTTKQAQNGSSVNNIRIPAKSVQEIVIQIVRNTKRPVKGENNDFNRCFKNRKSLRVLDRHEYPIYVENNVLPQVPNQKVDFNNNGVEEFKLGSNMEIPEVKSELDAGNEDIYIVKNIINPKQRVLSNCDNNLSRRHDLTEDSFLNKLRGESLTKNSEGTNLLKLFKPDIKIKSTFI